MGLGFLFYLHADVYLSEWIVIEANVEVEFEVGLTVIMIVVLVAVVRIVKADEEVEILGIGLLL